MTREEKAAVIESLVEKIQDNGHFYVADTGNLSVAEINNFRGQLFKNGLELHVAKNTLIQKALERIEGVDLSEMNEALVGFSGLIFSKENANAPAKVLKEYKKKNPRKDGKPALKGASIEYDIFVGEEHLDSLSKLKSKEELIGEVINLLQSPANNVVSALLSGRNKLAGIVKTLSEREDS